MTVNLRALTLDECQQVRLWRNDPAVLPMLRTGAKTEAEQAAFYRDVVSNPQSDHRYYAVETQDRWGLTAFVGMGGLTYLSRVPGEAEISLLLAPEARHAGIGARAVQLLLWEGQRLGLCCVIGECYRAGAVAFWQQAVRTWPDASVQLTSSHRAAGAWFGESYRFWFLLWDHEKRRAS